MKKSYSYPCSSCGISINTDKPLKESVSCYLCGYGEHDPEKEIVKEG